MSNTSIQQQQEPDDKDVDSRLGLTKAERMEEWKRMYGIGSEGPYEPYQLNNVIRGMLDNITDGSLLRAQGVSEKTRSCLNSYNATTVQRLQQLFKGLEQVASEILTVRKDLRRGRYVRHSSELGGDFLSLESEERRLEGTEIARDVIKRLLMTKFPK